jgi:hypothetical protein
MAFHEIDYLRPMKEPAENIRMFRTLLKGQAFSYFENHVRRRFSDNDLIKLFVTDVDLEYIPKRAIHVQKYFMRRVLYMVLILMYSNF